MVKKDEYFTHQAIVSSIRNKRNYKKIDFITIENRRALFVIVGTIGKEVDTVDLKN